MGNRSSRGKQTANKQVSNTMANSTLVGKEKGRQVLNDLLQANSSYVSGDLPPAGISSPQVRRNLADNGQAPGVAIVTCADSRVAPEIVFGAGLGSVFVIRNAGNTTWGDDVIGSLEYAVAALKVPLVMVMGHSKCGAIGAAVGAAKDGSASTDTSLGRHVKDIAEIIKPCVGSEQEVKDAVLMNVKEGVKSLKEGTSAVATMAASNDILLVGAVYDIHSGEVFVVDE